MRYAEAKNNQSKRLALPRDSRGIALITTLLLLSIMVAMTLAMTIAVTSDTLITRYYRNSRSSFYAADSGVNIVRQTLISQLNAEATANVTGSSWLASGQPALPIAANHPTTKMQALVNQYTSSAPGTINGGNGANSWPGSFYVIGSQSGTIGTSADAISATNCTVGYVTITGNPSNAGPYNCTTNIPNCNGTVCAVTYFQYSIPYRITVMGQARANEQEIVEDAGNLLVTVNIAQSHSYNSSFAAWGMFVDQSPICNGSYLVPGTITGPVFTNGSWNFGNTGSYTFTGKVGQVGSQFGWQGSSCSQSASYPRSGFSTTFQSTVSLGAPAVPLPANSLNQKEAVADGTGSSWATYTQAQINTAMHTDLMKGDASANYPSSPTSTPGVYLGFTSSGGASPTYTMTGGGIYVEGNANSVQLSTATPVVGSITHYQQIVTIKQGTSPVTTTTVTIDPQANTTVVSTKVGAAAPTSITINGIPENNTSGTPSAATMLYVDGNIGTSTTTGLSGPSQGVAAIQNYSAMTVAANGNINITGDLLYKEEPVTTTQNQIPGTPADTLIPGNNYGQVLGIFTANGNVNLYNQQSNNNLEIDASIATISNGGSGAIINPGNAISTLNIVGGRIQNTIQNINSTTRNVYFDQRFASGGFAPPWFPSTTVTTSTTDQATNVTTQANRTQWLNVF